MVWWGSEFQVQTNISNHQQSQWPIHQSFKKLNFLILALMMIFQEISEPVKSKLKI